MLGLEEAVGGCGPVGSARVEVVDRSQRSELLVGEPVQSVVEQSQLAIAPLHTGAGTLEQLGAGPCRRLDLFFGLGVDADDCEEGCVLAGDLNVDGVVDISDHAALLPFLFIGGPGCAAAADVNGDGRADLSDYFHLQDYLWYGGPAPVNGFVVGDANNDGALDISDLATLGSRLFGRAQADICLLAADVNEDGAVDISDFIVLENLLFG